MASNTKERKVKTSDRTFTILETVAEMERTSLSELAESLGMPKSTTHNHLRTLEEKGYLIEQDNEYQLGLKFLQFGQRARESVPIYTASRDVLEQVADETGEAVWVAAREGGEAFYVNKVMGARGVPSRGKIGHSIQMHASAMGKAILAHLPEDLIDEYIDRDLPALTDQTMTETDALLDELETIRDRDVAFNDCETAHGLRGVASPVIYEGRVTGAVAVAGARSRLQGEYFSEKLPAVVQEAADEIELRLAYDD